MLKALKISLCFWLLSLFIASCDQSKDQDNPFKSVNFPLESCSDPLPPDESAYPLEIYTVFIPDPGDLYTLVLDKYCPQVSGSTKIDKKGEIKFVLQIGSFIGRERAENFKNILRRDFENVQISEPTIITAGSFNKSSNSDNLSQPELKLNSPQEIGKSALLNESQLNDLLNIDGTPAFMGQAKYSIKVVLPTYIPQGFKLVQLKVNNSPEYGNEYILRYKNADNSCFMFRGGFVQPIGGPPVFAPTVNVNSAALGRVPITIISSDKINNQVYDVGFHRGFEERKFGQFDFSSPGYRYGGSSCKPMNFVESVKVAESFQFLQQK